jgi:hypothetical protein
MASRYQTGAMAKNRLGGDGGCRRDWKGAATNGFATGRNWRELVIAGYEAERKTARHAVPLREIGEEIPRAGSPRNDGRVRLTPRFGYGLRRVL